MFVLQTLTIKIIQPSNKKFGAKQKRFAPFFVPLSEAGAGLL